MFKITVITLLVLITALEIYRIYLIKKQDNEIVKIPLYDMDEINRQLKKQKEENKKSE